MECGFAPISSVAKFIRKNRGLSTPLIARFLGRVTVHKGL